MKKNLVQHNYKITQRERNLVNEHNSFLILFTGLSGAGKSTLACALERKLYDKKIKTYVLDGDNIRGGINKNLGFSPEDRSENNRRVGEISKLFIDAGLIVLAAFVAPYSKDREVIKQTVKPENYFEIFVNTSLEECERRDIKGLYQMARNGEIENLTGINAPYEKPLNPDIEILQHYSVEESVNMIYSKIKEKLLIK